MDPVTQVFGAAVVALNTAAQVEQLIQRLADHGRTLAQAEADRRASGDRLFPKASESDGVSPGQ